jgi:tRNA-modifying protein YgfZ
VLLPRSAADAVLEGFESQIIMEDVELVPAPDLRVLSVQGPQSSRAARAVTPELDVHDADELGGGQGVFVLALTAELDAVHARLLAEVERVGGRAVSDAGFELARLRSGRPRFGRDFGAQQYPQEAGLKELAVSFGKGCYLGQEVVCTLENRGRLTRRLARFESTTDGLPNSGAELLDAGGAVVGQLTSVVHDPVLGRTLALGYVKNAAAAAGKAFSSGSIQLSLVGLVGDG